MSYDQLAALYTRFADRETAGRSPLYEALAHGVAGDKSVLAFLATLPDAKRQPNLLFAAVRHLCGTARDYAGFRAKLLDHAEAVRAVMLTRSTQTNEPARCAVLLPLLARIPGPLALLEVGASAGLCLLPDRYAYDYGQGVVRGADAPDTAPVFPCRCDLTVPEAVPDVVWRAGLDLNPLDPRDGEQAAWLETLVWPDQPARAARLRTALAVARTDPPRVQRGDLLTDLPALAAEAPRGATLVVFHTAVLAYVTDPAARAAFAAQIRALGAVWISNEAPGVFPDIAAKARGRGPAGAFLLALDGEPIGWADPHGAWVRGLAA